MNLKEFRDRFPTFRPNALCQHRDGRYLEVISYPYCEDETRGAVFVEGRVPNDPSTIKTYSISGEEPDLHGLIARCERDQTTFLPIIQAQHQSAAGPIACCIMCFVCGRGYYQDKSRWVSDRPLTLIRSDTPEGSSFGWAPEEL